MIDHAVTLEIPRDAWEEIGAFEREDADPKSRMLCSVYIYGTLHHLEAIEIRYDDDGTIHAANEDNEEHLSRLWNGFDPGDQYNPVEIDGREYLLFMDPGC